MCPVDASGCSLLSAVHIWKPGSPFYELHLAAMRDQGPFFGAPVSVIGAGGAGVARSGTGITN